jgi:2-polyprenyl-3-methyl-5-hydroxy-6-metoxy-1,4-benzoquinol methylase
VNIVYINSPIYDYLTATVIEGLQELGHRVLCSEDSNYGSKVGDAELIGSAKDADLIIVGSNQGVRSTLLRTVENERRVYVDGADHPVVAPPEGIDFKLIFKRELLTCWHNAAENNVVPLPFGGEKRYGLLPPSSERGLKAAFLANLATNPLRFGVHQRLVNLGDPAVISGTTGERAYNPNQSLSNPIETPKYRQLLQQARIGINVAGAGWDCGRYWEILAAGAMLFTQELDIVIPNPFTDGKDCATFKSFDEFEEKLEYYLARPELCTEIAERGQAHYLEFHTSKARAKYLLEQAHARLGAPLEVAPHAPSADETTTDASNESADSIPAPASEPRAKARPTSGFAPKPEAKSDGIVGSPTGTPSEVNAPNYYGHARPEVVQLVPHNARRILDIGCGAGALGLAIKQRQPCHVTGIEYVPEVAAKAAQVLDTAIAGDAFAELEGLPIGHFDAIVMADVLEHVDDSDRLLSLARERLAPGGKLILSLPNVRHWSVVLPLLGGRWDYQDAGILDRTHLRFFTRHNMLEMMQRNALNVENVQASMMPLDFPGGVFAALIALGINPSELLEDLQRYQYLLVCTKAQALAA